MADNKNKRGAKGGGSVRQRPDGKWEARCTINGKTRSFYAEKQVDALKKMREAQKQADDGVFFNPTTMTLAQWSEIWLNEYYSGTVKLSTFEKTKLTVEHHIKSNFSKIKLKDLKTTHLQMYYNRLKKDKLAPGTIKGISTTVNLILDQAVELKYIPFNPNRSCKLPKNTQRKPQFLTEEQIKKLLEEIKKDSYGDLLFIALFTGMRKGEVLGLPWSAIDFKNSTITVKQQLKVSGKKANETGKAKYYISTTKNGKERVLTVAPFVMDVLRKVRREQTQNHLLMGLAWENEWDLVFTDKTGKHHHINAAYEHFKKIARKIGIPDAHLHDLRHTYAVTSIQEGDDPKTLQENLGHATATFSLEVYAHVSDKMKQDSAKRMQAFYDELQKKA